MSLLRRFLSRPLVDHVAAGETRAPARRPGDLVSAMAALMLMTVVIPAPPAEAAAAAAHPIESCAVSDAGRADFAADVARHETAEGRRLATAAAERLSKSPVGRVLLDSAAAHGVTIHSWTGLTQMGLRAAFLPEKNVVLFDPVLGDNAPHVLGHELYHAKGFHDGTGAAVTPVDLAKLDRAQRLKSLGDEEAVAWSLQAQIAHDLTLAGDPAVETALRAHPDYVWMANSYQKVARDRSPAAAFRSTVAYVHTVLEGSGVHQAMYGALWDRSVDCLENQGEPPARLPVGADLPGAALARDITALIDAQSAPAATPPEAADTNDTAPSGPAPR